MANTQLFEDIFGIRDIDPDEKKFLRVSRIVAVGENYETELLLDVNTMLYPMEIGERFTMVLASTLDLTGEAPSGEYDASTDPKLSDKFDYVMHGKVYRCDEAADNNKLSVFVSFGGLLMRLTGDVRNLQTITLDSMIYLLIRKT
eukprot:m.31064 g.31064  ORF g.31064 m.31064 type:complete len:145 (+) comp16390_c1_seq1:135-569(+)